jgi:hypothetical protein
MEAYTDPDLYPNLTPGQISLALDALRATKRHELFQALEGRTNGDDIQRYLVYVLTDSFKAIAKGKVGYTEAQAFLASINEEDDQKLAL